VLQLTGVVAGRYVFQLTVTDDVGHTSISTASVLVKPGWFEFSAINRLSNQSVLMA